MKNVQVEFQSLIDSAENLWILEAEKRFSNFSLTIESRRVEGTLAKFNQPGEKRMTTFNVLLYRIQFLSSAISSAGEVEI